MIDVEFFAPAEAEFMDAIDHYNMESEGLGFEFAAEVRRTIERIIQYPDAWIRLSRRTRRCRTNRFPYGVIYQVRERTVFIVGVMHLSREPQTWRSRLKKEDL